MAHHKLCVRDAHIVIRTDAVILQRIQAAAQYSLDHKRMESCRTELPIELCKLHGTHSLVQHLSDDLFFYGVKQYGILIGSGRFAHSFKEDRHELLLPCYGKDSLPVYVFGRQLPTGNSGFGDLQELGFDGGEDHVAV